MSSSFLRLTQIGYVFALSLALCLLLMPSSSQAQKGFGVSSGYRATPGLPTIAIPMINFSNGGVGGNVGGSVVGVGGGAGGTNVSGSFSTSIVTVNLGQFFPNNGQLIGLPPPTLMPPLFNNFSDGTGNPWALLLSGGGGGGGGVGGGGLGGGGIAGGVGGVGGIGGGGMGGFAGKGMGGFNGKKAL